MNKGITSPTSDPGLSCPVDGAAHNFLTAKPDWVYCTKCRITYQLTYGGVNPEPPNPINPDARPIKVFQASGGDDTAGLQNWVNQQPSDAIYDIRGTPAINQAGLRISGKNNVKVTSSDGGGIKAVGSGLYTSPFSSLVYAEGFNNSTFDRMKFDSAGKKAMGLFICRSSQVKVTSCECGNVANDPNGAPWAALYGEQNSDVEIAYCSVHDTPAGIRGIWFGVGDRFDRRPHIHHCTVRNTGHTCIITESEAPYVHDNQVYGAGADGTGYKFIARGAVMDAVWENNLVDGTQNAGMMIEASGIQSKIFVRAMVAKNCGKLGTSFGMVYVSGGAGVKNLEVSGCTLDNCRRLAGVQYLYDSVFKNNTVNTGSNVVDFERDCNNVQLSQSGKASIGSNVTNVWVDGQKVA